MNWFLVIYVPQGRYPQTQVQWEWTKMQPGMIIKQSTSLFLFWHFGLLSIDVPQRTRVHCRWCIIQDAPWLRSRDIEIESTPGALTIYTECLEILLGKRKWYMPFHLKHFRNYRLPASSVHFFFSLCSSTFCDISVLRLDKLQHWTFTPKISTEWMI